MASLTNNQKRITPLALALLALATAPAFAGIIRVPADQATIAAALTASVSGDEIRVANNFVETSTQNIVTGKNLTIASYDAAYATPTAGATWVLASGGGGATAGLIQLTNATLTFSGFSQVTVPGASAFFLGADATLTVNDTTFSGITLTNTAAIQANAVASPNVTVNNCVFNANGRGIWYQNASTAAALTITGSTFTANTSSPVEFRTAAGTHTFSMSRSSISQAAGSAMRLYFFFNTGGADMNVTANIDRCSFTQTATTITNLFAVSGTATTAGAGSNVNVTVTNSLFNLTSAGTAAPAISNIDTSGAPRKANLTIRHSTFILGAAGQSAVYAGTDTNATVNVANSIVSGPGTALKTAASTTSTITSGKNLFNGGTVSSGSGITLSGTEITAAPDFVGASDFHLNATSPAVDAGAALGVVVDLDGNVRPSGAGPDLGAYEYIAPTAVNDWNLY